MNNLLLILVVLIIAVGGLFMVARLLDQRGQRSRSAVPVSPPPGKVAGILLWIARGLIALAVLFIIGAIAFKSMPMVWLAGSCLFLYILDGIAYRIVLQRER